MYWAAILHPDGELTLNKTIAAFALMELIFSRREAQHKNWKIFSERNKCLLWRNENRVLWLRLAMGRCYFRKGGQGRAQWGTDIWTETGLMRGWPCAHLGAIIPGRGSSEPKDSKAGTSLENSKSIRKGQHGHIVLRSKRWGEIACRVQSHSALQAIYGRNCWPPLSPYYLVYPSPIMKPHF